jgi:Guanylate-binding protein, N-terminal domain
MQILTNLNILFIGFQFKTVSNNQLINADDWLGNDNEPLTGFEWKAGTQRVTSGLILWSDVFLYDDPKGDKIAIYLMDTQGLFDHKSSSTDNSRIFSLSTMISSIQILNLLNIIQENQLQYLQFATEYARYASADEEKSPFQNLLILIRDWNSPEEYKYGLRGGNAYLNSFLEIHDYQTRDLQSVRRYLRSSFEKIDCFLMPHPGRSVARDSTYDGRWSEIDEDFVNGMQDLFKHLFAPNKLKLKQINGVPVKPADLLIFISSYVENFKNDSMPEATNIYEQTLDKQFRILMGKSVDIYVNAVAAHDAELNGEDDVNRLHASAKDKTLKFYNSEKKFGDHAEGANYKRELLKKLEEVFQQWKKVSMSHIRTLQQQKDKTVQQVIEVKQAQVQDNRAKQELEVATKNAEDAKKALEQARFDTAEARREAEDLRQKSIEAEKGRAEAIEKENQTREWLEKMTKDKEYFEQQFNEYKANAAQNVGQTLENSQRESGFSSKFIPCEASTL